MKFSFIFLLIFFMSLISLIDAKPPAPPSNDDSESNEEESTENEEEEEEQQQSEEEAEEEEEEGEEEEEEEDDENEQLDEYQEEQKVPETTKAITTLKTTTSTPKPVTTSKSAVTSPIKSTTTVASTLTQEQTTKGEDFKSKDAKIDEVTKKIEKAAETTSVTTKDIESVTKPVSTTTEKAESVTKDDLVTKKDQTTEPNPNENTEPAKSSKDIEPASKVDPKDENPVPKNEETKDSAQPVVVVVHETEAAKLNEVYVEDIDQNTIDEANSTVAVETDIKNPQIDSIVEEIQPAEPEPTSLPAQESSTQSPSTQSPSTQSPSTQIPSTLSQTQPPNEPERFMLRPKHKKIQKIIHDKVPSVCVQSAPLMKNGQIYKHACVIDQLHTYQEAHDLCLSHDMDLFIVQFVDDNFACKQQLSSLFTTRESYWVNGRKITLWYFFGMENGGMKRIIYPGTTFEGRETGSCMRIMKFAAAQPYIAFNGADCEMKLPVLCEYVMP